MSVAQVLLLIAAVSVTIGTGVLFLFRDRIHSVRARRTVERLRHEEAAGSPPSPHDYRYGIAFDSVGVSVSDLRYPTNYSERMSWAEVARAITFKEDRFVNDCICLFLARADGTGIELNEEMAGWISLAEALPRHLPTCKPWTDWFSTVAFPPFFTNLTEIYVRGATQIAEPVEETNVG